MSLVKAASDGLKNPKCKKIASHKSPPIPYNPEKDCTQETVSAFKDNHLKMQISKGMEWQVSIWHSCMYKAFLIHMESALEAIERKEYFKAYVESNKVYTEQMVGLSRKKLN